MPIVQNKSLTVNMILEDDAITIEGPNYKIIEKCTFEDAIFLAVGLGRLFKNSLLKQLMKSSSNVEIDTLKDSIVIRESSNISLDFTTVESGMDGSGTIFVHHKKKILFEGSMNDSAIIFTILCNLFDAKTINQLIHCPEKVSIIRLNDSYLC